MNGTILKLRRGETNSLTDRNGYKYREVKGNNDADISTLFDFECDKNRSQKCMAKLKCNKMSMEGILITPHSCRWSYEEIPDYRKNNIYIKTGYHPTTSTWCEQFHLLYTLHSETINIWSHMVGIFLFCGYLLDSLFNDDDKYYWIALLFDLGALIMFATSTAFHWLHICSENSSNKHLFLDFCGIGGHIYVNHVSWLYHGLFPDDLLFYVCVFIQSIIFAMAIISSYRAVYSYVYRSVEWEANEQIRCGLCLAPLLGVYFTMVYQYLLVGSSPLITSECWISHLIMVITYVSGFTIYVIKCPEALWPGKFDLYFNSHQIMHVMILLATVLGRNHFLVCLRLSK